MLANFSLIPVQLSSYVSHVTVANRAYAPRRLFALLTALLRAVPRRPLVR